MNKICKEYISDAKKFFPIMGKKERAYLRGIVSELEDCIERENITSKQELQTKYRQPYDLANDYYSRFETDEIVKKISISKYIKSLILILIVTLLIALTAYISFAVHHQIQYSREEIVGTKQTTLVDDSDKEHNVEKSNNYESLIEYNDEEIIDEEEIIE